MTVIERRRSPTVDSASQRVADSRPNHDVITLGRRTVTVLVASARHSVVRACRKAALTAGLTLVVSPDGLHALMTALRQPPALIVLDSALPGVAPDAVEMMLARDVRTAEVPVLRCVGAGVTDPSDRTPDGHVA
jgi:CheY-like chemotaxis protein